MPKLETLASLTVGHVGSMAAEYRPSGIPFLRSQNVKPHRIDLSGVKYIDADFHDRLKKSALMPGDVVVVRTGKPGDAAVVPAGIGKLNCSDLVIIRPNADLDPHFLSYFINGVARGFISSRLVGAVQQHFNIGAARELEVPNLSLVEQRRISSALKALDDKVAANDHISKISLCLADANYLSAQSLRVSRTVLLRDAAHWHSGGTPKTSESGYWGGDIPWISAASLKSSWVDHSDRNVTREGVDNGTKLVQRNAVLFVVRGMSLKTEFRVGMSQREVAFGQDCKALVARDGIDPYYLFYSIRSKAEHILTLVDEAGHGTGRLVTDRLEKLEIPLLAEPVQGELVAKLSLLSELAAARQRESRKLVELRDTLLPKLMSGELRIKDAERKVEDAT